VIRPLAAACRQGLSFPSKTDVRACLSSENQKEEPGLPWRKEWRSWCDRRKEKGRSSARRKSSLFAKSGKRPLPVVPEKSLFLNNAPSVRSKQGRSFSPGRKRMWPERRRSPARLGEGNQYRIHFFRADRAIDHASAEAGSPKKGSSRFPVEALRTLLHRSWGGKKKLT